MRSCSASKAAWVRGSSRPRRRAAPRCRAAGPAAVADRSVRPAGAPSSIRTGATPCADEHAGGRDAGRTGADDCDPYDAETPARASATCMPSATAVVQARTRWPSASHTQQSWQAPIRQKPARISSLNSCRRSALRAASTATSTLSPANAVTSAPSTRMRTGGPSGTIARTSSAAHHVLRVDETMPMLAEHAASFNPAFDSGRARLSRCRSTAGVRPMSNAVILTDSHRRHRHRHAEQAVEAQRLGHADARRDQPRCSTAGIAIRRSRP